MKNNLSFLGEFKNSIISLQSYVNYPKQTFKQSIKYLILLVCILGTISLITPLIQFNSTISLISETQNKKIPEIHIKDGIVNINPDEEYLLESSNSIILINPDLKIKDFSLSKYNSGIVLTKNKLYIKLSSFYNEFWLSNELNTTIDSDFIDYLIPILKVLNPIIIIFGIIGVFIASIIPALILSFIINLTSNNIGLPFTGVLKMSIHAITLPMILKTIESILGKAVPFSGAIFYIIAFLYVNQGLVYLRKEFKK